MQKIPFVTSEQLETELDGITNSEALCKFILSEQPESKHIFLKKPMVEDLINIFYQTDEDKAEPPEMDVLLENNEIKVCIFVNIIT